MKTQSIKHNDGISISVTKRLSTLCALFAVLLALLAAASYASAQVTGGTWTQVAVPFPGGSPDQSLLLTDGTVMVQELDTGNWWRLIPDQYGNYANGAWKAIASMPPGYAPFAYGAAVLPDGRAIAEGGEHNYGGGTNCTGSGSGGDGSNCGAIFDPTFTVAGNEIGKWTFVPPPDFGETCGTDGTSWCAMNGVPTVILSDGTLMIGHAGYSDNDSSKPPSTLQALLPPPYDPTKKPWVQTGIDKHDGNGEEGWTLLPNFGGPDGLSLVLTVDTYSKLQGSTVCGGYNSSELYVKATNFGGDWYCLGDTPNQLYPGVNEMGPAILRPDGTVFQAGADQYTAILRTDHTWSAGPAFPTNASGKQLEMEDGPAALLPNGNVLMMASEDETTAPATFLELTPAPQNHLFVVPGVPYANNLSSNSGQMLLLPTGQVLFIPHWGISSYLEIYTPTNPNYDPSWAPVICGGACSYNQPVQIYNNATNAISGLKFNGMSQGAAFGDEYQSATNYPLVRITDSSGGQPVVYYCRTHHHSSMGVQTDNQTVSTWFDCPDVPTGTVGDLEVVANGIPSNKMLVTVANDQCVGDPVSIACVPQDVE